MMVHRTCNALEAIFVKCNIRFAAGVSFEPVSIEKAEAALLSGLLVSGLGRLTVVVDEEDSRLSLLDSTSACSTPQRITSTTALAQTVEDLVARNDDPSFGRSVSSFILVDDCYSSTGVVINANHALCDGRLMKTCIEIVLQSLVGSVSPVTEPGPLGDLKAESIKTLVLPEPRFLPLKGSSIVNMKEIPQFLADPPSDSSLTIRMDISGSTVISCQSRLKSKATLTGFMMACWIQAISEAVASPAIVGTTTDAASPSSSTTTAVSISCLVDIRPQLPPALYTNAFGTVTVSGVGFSSTNDGVDNVALASYLVDLAASCTQDLKGRIQRGEAQLQSFVLCQGDFENGGPPGTIELSNHGVYTTTPATRELAMQQRFDGYDGVSVSMVSESDSGVMRLVANAGAMFRRAAILALMERVVELWGVVAAEAQAE